MDSDAYPEQKLNLESELDLEQIFDLALELLDDSATLLTCRTIEQERCEKYF